METIMSFLGGFTLFGGVFLFWFSVIGLFFFSFYSESKENGFIAFYAFIIFLILTHFWSNLDLTQFLDPRKLGVYMFIGIIYSYIKTLSYGRKKKNEREEIIKEYHPNHSRITQFDENIKEKLRGNVFRWGLLWPISLISWIFTDLVKDLFNIIYDKVSFSYNKVLDYGLGVNKVDKTLEDIEDE